MSTVIGLEQGAAALRAATASAEARPDAAAWVLLAEATTIESFGRAWIVLTARSAEALRRMALMTSEPGSSALQPVARWSLRPRSEEDGFVESLKPVLEAALETRRPALEGVGRSGQGGADTPTLVAYPVIVSESLRGVILAEAAPLDTAGARRLVRHIQWSSGWLEAFLRRSTDDAASRLAWRASFLMQSVEVVSAASSCRNAARIFAGLLARELGCEQVAVGRTVARRTRILAFSQTAVFDRRSRQVRAFAAAADEAIDQQTALAAPADPDRQPYVMAAQDALSRLLDGAHVLTIPLVASAAVFGAVTLVRRDRAFTQEEVDLVDAAGTGIAPVLADKAKGDRGLLALARDRLRDALGKLFGRRHLGLKLVALALLALTTALVFAEHEYRIRARSEVQGETRRMLSAPFDGFVKAARARAGDLVRDGDVLAELLDNDLVLDRLRHLSRKRQFEFELSKALAKRDLAAANIAQAQVAQADADIELAEQMLSRASLRSPFDAVVVTGDLSQSIGKPVTRGDVLFELAPLDQYRITAVVPESEIRFVRDGMKGEVLLSAIPERPIPFTIRTITPVARVSDGINGFEVIGTLDERDQRIRPGMEGVAKIAAGNRSSFWIWTHSFWHWLRVKVWEHIP